MKIEFYNLGGICNHQFDFVVICASYKGEWIFTRHRDKNTWSIPSGGSKGNEDIDAAASRMLLEETGALNFQMEPVCDCSVTTGQVTASGRLFYAKVDEMRLLPYSEACGISFSKTMPDNPASNDIQPRLYAKVLEYLCSRAISLLQKDMTRNINIINFIENYPVYSCDMVGDSILVRGRSDEDWVYISSKYYDEFQKIIKGLNEEDKCFAILEDWMLPYIVKGKKIRSKLTCMKLTYDENMPLPPVKSRVVGLSVADAPYIFENSKYKEYTSIKYIEDRIKNGIGLGIYEDEKLVAWLITHDDGAIGFLNVLEEYRRKGYGTDITVEMIKRLLNLGKMPFVHIEEDNIKSMNLALKAGFRKDRRIHWIKLD